MASLEPFSDNPNISVILVMDSIDDLLSPDIFLIFGMQVVFSWKLDILFSLCYETLILLKLPVLTGCSDANLTEEGRNTALLLPGSGRGRPLRGVGGHIHHLTSVHTGEGKDSYLLLGRGGSADPTNTHHPCWEGQKCLVNCWYHRKGASLPLDSGESPDSLLGLLWLHCSREGEEHFITAVCG